MKILKPLFKILLIIALILFIGKIITNKVHHYKKMNYWKCTPPTGKLENKYTQFGSNEVLYQKFDAPNEDGNYHVWYPKKISDNTLKYPMIIIANGTNETALSNKTVYEHLASWGFIIVGNDDKNSRTGASSENTLKFMLSEDSNTNSLFYQRIDIQNIGIQGGSQGGVATINSVTNQPSGSFYKAMFTVSATSPFYAQADRLGSEWIYDVSNINIPYFMSAGTGKWDAGEADNPEETEKQGICSLWSMHENYNKISSPVTKLMGRYKGVDHTTVLSAVDAYMTSWFLYWLQDDKEAGQVFFGENAEILTNQNWQDVQISE